MTVGLSLVLYRPEADTNQVTEAVALYSYLTLAVYATVNATVGIYYAGHGTAQAGWWPAHHTTPAMMAVFPLNQKTQQKTLIAIQQLTAAIFPLCYLEYGGVGLGIAALQCCSLL